MYMYPMLNYFILVMGNTGTRTGEAFKLKWRNVEFVHKQKDLEYSPSEILDTDFDYNDYFTFLNVDGKTGEREAQSNDICMKYLKGLWEFSKYNALDDYLFCHQIGKHSGNRFLSFHASWKRLMEQSELLKCKKTGKPRSYYSLRHTYATIKVNSQEQSPFDLKDNMGTSIRMLDHHYYHGDAKERAKRIEANKKGMNLQAERIAELEAQLDAK